jgi:CBS domain containing-hemolysin-like protein
MTSLGIVLIVDHLFASPALAETAAPLMLSPLIFVYCELLPKQLFFQAPNRLLRRSGPLLLLFAVLFSPVAAILWVLGWLVERALGQTPLRVQLALAGKELQRVLREGEQAGILHTAQRNLAQRVFDHAAENIQTRVTPLNRVLAVPLGAKAATAYHLARRQKSAVIPVHEPGGHRLIGYTRLIDLRLANADRVDSVRPLPRIARTESHLGALMQLQAAKADAALVEDRSGQVVGLVFASQLTESLFPPV